MASLAREPVQAAAAGAASLSLCCPQDARSYLRLFVTPSFPQPIFWSVAPVTSFLKLPLGPSLIALTCLAAVEAALPSGHPDELPTFFLLKIDDPHRVTERWGSSRLPESH